VIVGGGGFEHEQVTGTLLADQAGHLRSKPGQRDVDESTVRVTGQFHAMDACRAGWTLHHG
jgi:hypothetical protein